MSPKQNKQIQWGWILAFILLFFSLICLSSWRSTEKKLASSIRTSDSLRNEIILLQDQLEARKEEVDLLLQLNEDDFDRVNDIEKIERLFQE